MALAYLLERGNVWVCGGDPSANFTRVSVTDADRRLFQSQ